MPAEAEQDLGSWSDWDGAESDAPSTASERPEDWQSDDEPPEDHAGDEQVCSRDGRVKKVIRSVGRGLDRPGQYDVVQVHWKQLDGTTCGPEAPGAGEAEVHMGEDQLPLAVELALKQMRVGETADIVAPAAYANLASPLVGRKLRDHRGKLPKHGKVPRKFRFLPMAPRGLEIQAKATSSTAPPPKGGEDAHGDGSKAATGPPEFRARVELRGLKSVHMLTEDRSVYKSILTPGRGLRTPRRGDWVWFSIERDGAEAARHSCALHAGSRGLPAAGLDHVLLSMKEGERCIATLPSTDPLEISRPASAIWNYDDEVKAFEDAAAAKPGAAGGDAADAAHADDGAMPPPRPARRPKWRRWRYSPPEVRKLELRVQPEVSAARANSALMPGDTFSVAEERRGADGVLFLRLADGRGWAFDRLPGPGELCVREEPLASLAPPQHLKVTLHGWRRRDRVPVPPSGTVGFRPDADERCNWPMMDKLELRPGPERLPHEVEEGCPILAGFRLVDSPCTEQWIVSWCMGEGSVPGYFEAAIASMRAFEVSQFEVPAEAARACTQIGPEYEGRTPLRIGGLPEMDDVVRRLLEACPSEDAPPGEAEAAKLAAEPEQPPVRLRDDWSSAGVPSDWSKEVGVLLPFDGGSEAGEPAARPTCCLRVTLLAVREAPDVCTMPEDMQREYLERERAHGNALARLSRWSEASAAYGRALDSVRRTAVYKALFPTERGLIQGAYSRDAAEDIAASGAALVDGMDASQRQAFNSGLISLHLNLALCAARQGRIADCRRHASIVLGAEPDNAKALFRRGAASVVHGEYDEALKDLQRAAELQPQDRAIRDELQGLHRKMKEHKARQKNMFQKAFQPSSRQEGAGSVAAEADTEPRAADAG